MGENSPPQTWDLPEGVNTQGWVLTPQTWDLLGLSGTRPLLLTPSGSHQNMYCWQAGSTVLECCLFYRTQRKLWKGDVFTSVCQEFCPQVGGVHPLVTPLPPLGRHPSTPGRDPPMQTPPPPPRQMATACNGYASYSNAFLLSKMFTREIYSQQSSYPYPPLLSPVSPSSLSVSLLFPSTCLVHLASSEILHLSLYCSASPVQQISEHLVVIIRYSKPTSNP